MHAFKFCRTWLNGKGGNFTAPNSVRGKEDCSLSREQLVINNLIYAGQAGLPEWLRGKT